MKEYEAIMYDVVMVLNIEDSENLKSLGLDEKEEYMVSYVFADGRCILYEEVPIGRNIPPIIHEYIIKSEDVKHLSFLYNYMDEVGFDNEYYESDYDDGDMLLLEKNYLQYEWTEHDFEVGDFVYFKDVRVIKFYQEAELQNDSLYQITSVNQYNNCPMIKTKIGEFDLYPNELKYLCLYDGDVYDDIKDNLDKILDLISNEVKQRNYEIAMDIALSENDIDKAQEIFNMHNNIK